MNERILDLANKATSYCDTLDVADQTIYQDIWKREFAELIVRECIEQGNNLANHYINTHSEQEQVMLLASITDYSNEIKKHFGVEE